MIGPFSLLILANQNDPFNSPIVKTADGITTIYSPMRSWLYLAIGAVILLAIAVFFIFSTLSKFQKFRSKRKKSFKIAQPLIVSATIAVVTSYYGSVCLAKTAYHATKYIQVTPTHVHIGGMFKQPFELDGLELAEVKSIDRWTTKHLSLSTNPRLSKSHSTYRLEVRKYDNSKIFADLDWMTMLAEHPMQAAITALQEQRRIDDEIAAAEKERNTPPAQTESAIISSYYGPNTKLYSSQPEVKDLRPVRSLMSLRKGWMYYLPTKDGRYEEAEILELYAEGYIKFRFLHGPEKGQEFFTLHEFDTTEDHFDTKRGTRVILAKTSGPTGRYDEPGSHQPHNPLRMTSEGSRFGSRGPRLSQSSGIPERALEREADRERVMAEANRDPFENRENQSTPRNLMSERERSAQLSASQPSGQPRNGQPSTPSSNDESNSYKPEPVPKVLTPYTTSGVFKVGGMIRPITEKYGDFKQAEVIETYREGFIKIRIPAEYSATMMEETRITPRFGLLRAK